MTTWAFQVAARTLWQEARGEPSEGIHAVAQVIKNRWQSGRWGKSLASVCLWRAQFSGWYVPSDPNFAGACYLADDDPELLAMQSVLQTVLDSDQDPTGGATHYYAMSMTTPPSWASSMVFCGQFGRQRFYRDAPTASSAA